jgi:twitching motility two-component system response regulator PilH
MGVRTETLVDSDVILIVDDSRFIAHAYSKVLAGLGYRVMIACDGRTGIFAAESCKPSLILLDMIMPDMDGLAVLRTLKRTPSTTNIPVLITSSLSKNNADKLILEGAAGYFEKGDMTEGKLEHVVSEILKKRLLVPDGEGGLTTEL